MQVQGISRGRKGAKEHRRSNSSSNKENNTNKKRRIETNSRTIKKQDGGIRFSATELNCNLERVLWALARVYSEKNNQNLKSSFLVKLVVE